jgi:hypothetical protein
VPVPRRDLAWAPVRYDRYRCRRMELLDDEQHENLLRPIFRDQEWVVVAIGFLFGELQVHLLLH